MSPISPDVAGFLLELIGRQQLSAGAPDFDQVVELLQRARRELTDALGAEATPA